MWKIKLSSNIFIRVRLLWPFETVKQGSWAINNHQWKSPKEGSELDYAYPVGSFLWGKQVETITGMIFFCPIEEV